MNQVASLKDLLTNTCVVPKLSESQVETIITLLRKFLKAVERLRSFDTNESKNTWLRLQSEARKNPTDEAFDALEKAGSKLNLRVAFRTKKQVAKRVVEDIRRNDLAPYIVPILRGIWDEMNETVSLWAAADAERRADFPSLELHEPAPLILGVQNGMAAFGSAIVRLGIDLGVADLLALFAELGISLPTVSEEGETPTDATHGIGNELNRLAAPKKI